MIKFLFVQIIYEKFKLHLYIEIKFSFFIKNIIDFNKEFIELL